MKRAAEFVSPQHAFLKTLSRWKVDFIIVGVSGIKYYARTAREVLSTMDYDVFIRPEAKNLERAIKAVLKQECSISYLAPGQKLVSIRKPNLKLCENLVRKKSVLVAAGPYHTIYDLVQEISGFTFEQMQVRAAKMTDKKLGFSFQVGRLEDLLNSQG